MAQPHARQQYDPTTQYAVDVVDGRIVTGKPVLWACQRHLDDLENGGKRGLWFDPDAAQDVFDFFGLLRHFEGELAVGEGQPIILEPWEEFILGSIFGWKRAGGERRFREAWIRVARKNGKSLIAAGVGLYCLVADGEPGAQVFAAATKRAQARVIFRAAEAMRAKSPSLRRVAQKFRDRIVVEASRSYLEPLGKEFKTEDGKNPHAALIDEVHAHGDAGIWNVLKSGMGARRQPLLFGITTAGFGVNTFGQLKDGYYRSIVDPKDTRNNESAFVYIAEMEPKRECGRCKSRGLFEGKRCEACAGRGFTGDDPFSEASWIKANPNLGVSVRIDKMREDAQAAKDHPPDLDEFLAKRCNLWIQKANSQWTPEQWDACGERAEDVTLEDLKGRPCFAGLDLASTTDTCAFIRYFPPYGKHKIAAALAHFWVPEDRIDGRFKKDGIDYQTWVDQGYIQAVPGSSIDQTVLYTDLLEMATQYPIQLLKYDPRDAQMLATLLEGAGWRLQKSGQGYAEYNAPTKELDRIIFDAPLAHFGNPVLRWMIGNVVLAKNVDGDVMPAKGKSAEKIDGAAALIMAIGAAGTNPIKVALPPVHHVLPKRGPGGGPGRGGGSRQIFRQDMFK
jgi:phage terminase large subunit-like protein